MSRVIVNVGDTVTSTLWPASISQLPCQRDGQFLHVQAEHHEHEPKHHQPQPQQLSTSITCVCFHPDDESQFVFGCSQGSVYSVHLRQNQLLFCAQMGREVGVQEMTFARTATTLFLACLTSNQMIYLMDWDSACVRHVIDCTRVHQHPVTGITGRFRPSHLVACEETRRNTGNRDASNDSDNPTRSGIDTNCHTSRNNRTENVVDGVSSALSRHCPDSSPSPPWALLGCSGDTIACWSWGCCADGVPPHCIATALPCRSSHPTTHDAGRNVDACHDENVSVCPERVLWRADVAYDDGDEAARTKRVAVGNAVFVSAQWAHDGVGVIALQQNGMLVVYGMSPEVPSHVVTHRIDASVVSPRRCGGAMSETPLPARLVVWGALQLPDTVRPSCSVVLSHGFTTLDQSSLMGENSYRVSESAAGSNLVTRDATMGAMESRTGSDTVASSSSPHSAVLFDGTHTRAAASTCTRASSVVCVGLSTSPAVVMCVCGEHAPPRARLWHLPLSAQSLCARGKGKANGPAVGVHALHRIDDRVAVGTLTHGVAVVLAWNSALTEVTVLFTLQPPPGAPARCAVSSNALGASSVGSTMLKRQQHDEHRLREPKKQQHKQEQQKKQQHGNKPRGDWRLYASGPGFGVYHRRCSPHTSSQVQNRPGWDGHEDGDAGLFVRHLPSAQSWWLTSLAQTSPSSVSTTAATTAIGVMDATRNSAKATDTVRTGTERVHEQVCVPDAASVLRPCLCASASAASDTSTHAMCSRKACDSYRRSALRVTPAQLQRWIDLSSALDGMEDVDGEGTRHAQTPTAPPSMQLSLMTHSVVHLCDTLTSVPFAHNMNALRHYLCRYGCFPKPFRAQVWRFALALPHPRVTAPQYTALLRRIYNAENSCATTATAVTSTDATSGSNSTAGAFTNKDVVKRMMSNYPLPTGEIRTGIETVLLCLLHQSQQSLSCLTCLPAMVYPILCTLGPSNTQSCAEMMWCWLLNWGREFAYMAHTRSGVAQSLSVSSSASSSSLSLRLLRGLDSLLAIEDSELHTHLCRTGASVWLWGWAVMENMYTDILTAAEWAQVMDHAMLTPPLWLFMFHLCWLISLREWLLQQTDTAVALRAVVHSARPSQCASVSSLIVAAHEMTARYEATAIHTTRTTVHDSPRWDAIVSESGSEAEDSEGRSDTQERVRSSGIDHPVNTDTRAMRFMTVQAMLRRYMRYRPLQSLSYACPMRDGASCCDDSAAALSQTALSSATWTTARANCKTRDEVTKDVPEVSMPARSPVRKCLGEMDANTIAHASKGKRTPTPHRLLPESSSSTWGHTSRLSREEFMHRKEQSTQQLQPLPASKSSEAMGFYATTQQDSCAASFCAGTAEHEAWVTTGTAHADYDAIVANDRTVAEQAAAVSSACVRNDGTHVKPDTISISPTSATRVSRHTKSDNINNADIHGVIGSEGCRPRQALPATTLLSAAPSATSSSATRKPLDKVLLAHAWRSGSPAQRRFASWHARVHCPASQTVIPSSHNARLRVPGVVEQTASRSVLAASLYDNLRDGAGLHECSRAESAGAAMMVLQSQHVDDTDRNDPSHSCKGRRKAVRDVCNTDNSLPSAIVPHQSQQRQRRSDAMEHVFSNAHGVVASLANSQRTLCAAVGPSRRHQTCLSTDEAKYSNERGESAGSSDECEGAHERSQDMYYWSR